MQKITPFLWFDSQAEGAANFYVSIFPDSRVVRQVRYDEASARSSGRDKGSVMTVDFELSGQKFVALNGGPQFQFTPAISFVVTCQTDQEVDHFWEKLTAEGKEVQCGWLEDKFGVSWQIVPAAMFEMLSDQDPAKSQRVMQAMLTMKKLDIKKLREVYEGAP